MFSFKHPSATELEHDFLWRTSRDLPERGRIGIFNRSYYEEVLIARVHPEILRSEAIPETPRHDKKVWHHRYRSIVDLEKHLYVNGTRIIKFFLHLSKEEQRKRFLARIDEPDKNWKFSLADIAERKFWKHYMKAYEECLSATSTHHSPWYAVPADDKENARLIVSSIVLDTFEELKMSYPKTSAKRRRELRPIGEELAILIPTDGSDARCSRPHSAFRYLFWPGLVPSRSPKAERPAESTAPETLENRDLLTFAGGVFLFQMGDAPARRSRTAGKLFPRSSSQR